ncbi:MAG: TonB-dependent receptor [Flavobacteriales bacterium]|nr:TonB-dependent receptor [Flavobacteriales bacterium]
MPKYLIVTITFLLSFTVSAQKAAVKGVVSDNDGIGVPNVSVRNLNSVSEVTYTFDDGTYLIDVTPGTVILKYNFVGFSQQIDTLFIEPGQTLVNNVKLVSGVTTGPAIIEESGDRTGPMETLDPKISSQIPSTRGTVEDLLLQAPVNFTSELSSSYNVRGGSFDENLVYVNNIQVYRPFLVRAGQQEGLSFQNTDMIDNIKFSAGGFESKYGDKMSSVLDITYNDPDEFAGNITLSLLGASVQVEDVNDSGTFSHNTGVRYRNNAYVLGSLDEQGEYSPNYFDVQTYLTFKPKNSLRWKHHFLGNIARNRYNFIPQTRETDVGNINEALRLTIFFDGKEETGFDTYFGAFSSERLSDESKLTFTVSAFQTYEFENFDILGQYFLDELERDLGSDEFGEVLANRGTGGYLDHARNELEATVLSFNHKGIATFLNGKHTLEWGATIQYENIYDELSEWSLLDSAGFSTPHPQDSVGYEVPGLQPDQQIILNDVIKAKNRVESTRVMGYVQNSWRSTNEDGDEWTFNAGIRGNYWSFNNEFVGGPRANLSFKPKWYKKETVGTDSLVRRNVIFTLAGGMYWQPTFYREMRGLNGQINPDIKAQQAIHLVAGMNYVFKAFDRPFKFVGELYYKDLNRLIPYEVENVRLRYYATNSANGFATGADFMVNGEFIQGVQSWMRVSVLRTAEDIDNDQYFVFFNDEGKEIVPGFTLNDTPVDSTLREPGFIPRPTDQRVSISLLFQDEMPKWPEYKVFVSMFYGTGLPYGPPTFERYKDILRTSAYRRVDIGFSRDFVTDKNRDKDRWYKSGFISLEIFNILGINNTISYTWIEDVTGRNYGIPNFLTGRRVNLKVNFKF